MAKWNEFVGNRNELIEILDNKTQFSKYPVIPLEKYLLRSIVRSKLVNLGFDGKSMHVQNGMQVYRLSKAYANKLLNWMNEPDYSENYDMSIENSSLFAKGLYFVSKRAQQLSIEITEAVWKLLVICFGGGLEFRYTKCNSGYFLVLRVLCKKTGPKHCRTFVLSPNTPTHLAKQDICKAFGLTPTFTKWYDFLTLRPCSQIDAKLNIPIKTKQLLFENLTYLDTINSQGVFDINFKATRRYVVPGMWDTSVAASLSIPLFSLNHKENKKIFEKDFFGSYLSKSVHLEFDGPNTLSIAINRVEDIELKVKERIKSLARQTTKLIVYHKMDKFVLNEAQNCCEVLKVRGLILYKDRFCSLLKFSCLRKVEMNSLVARFGQLEARLFRVLETCDTLQEYKSSHFLGETRVGVIKEKDYFLFKFDPRIAERIKIPFATQHFYSVWFHVTSVTLSNPRASFTRQIYSVLLFIEPEKVFFPNKKKLHISPSEAMSKVLVENTFN